MKFLTIFFEKSYTSWMTPGISVLLVAGFVTTAQAATYFVNSTADPGDGVCDASCTLRDAILATNAGPGQDKIDFSSIVLPTDTVPVTITLATGLPLITDNVIMDASITETRVLPGNPAYRPLWDGILPRRPSQIKHRSEGERHEY